MRPVDELGRSFVVSSVGGWMLILGTAITFGPHEVYAEGSPIPMVGGLRLTILPAGTIAIIDLTGYVAVATGLLLVVVAAVHRGAARRGREASE